MIKVVKKGFIGALLVAFSKKTFQKERTPQDQSSTLDNNIVKLLDKSGNIRIMSTCYIKKGDIAIVEVGDIIPMDGEVIEGLALVDESAITGESVPVMKEAVEEFSLVLGGTRVVSNYLKIKFTKTPSESFYNKIAIPVKVTAI